MSSMLEGQITVMLLEPFGFDFGSLDICGLAALGTNTATVPFFVVDV